MTNQQNSIPVPFEPKRINRWKVQFPKEFRLNEVFIHETIRPTFKTDNSGHIVWQPIEFSFYDPIGPSTAQSLFELIRPPKEKGLLENIKDFIMRKPLHKPLYDPSKGFTYHLYMLDPIGVEVECWEISECIITAMEFGNLTYKNDGLVIPKMTIKPGKVTLLY